MLNFKTNMGNLSIIFVSFTFFFYQMYYILFSALIDPGVHRIIHLGFALTLVPLVIATNSGKHKWLKFVMYFLMLSAVALTLQLVIIYPKTMGALVLPPTQAMIAGGIALVLSVLFTWLRFGLIFPLIFFLFMIYAIWGRFFLPEAIQPPDVTFLRIVSWVAGDIFSESGLYGDILSLMANYIWVFMVFGALLQVSGALRFIKDLGMLFSSKLASGPGMLSVITSSLVGTVTGSTAANIAITGSFTIPLMKAAGYTPEQAGAIEAAASNGGQIMPPVMGVAAFILAEFIGIPYVKVILYAAIPSALYFICISLYVQLQAKKMKLQRQEVKIDGRELVLSSTLFFIPILTLILLLVQGFSLMYIGFWSIVSVFVTGLTSHFLRHKKEAKINWKDAKEKVVSGIITASEVSIIGGILGAIIAIVEMSGLGVTLGSYLVSFTGGNLFLVLIAAAIVCILLGTGVPTVAAYVITAAVLSRPITILGVPPVAAHLFIFIYAVYAHLTLPVATGVLVASRIARAGYWRTGIETLKASYITLILPFLLIYNPAIILQFQGLTISQIMFQFSVVLTLLISVALIVNNHGFTANLSKLERLVFLLATTSSLLFMILPTYGIFLGIVAPLLCVTGVAIGYIREKIQRLVKVKVNLPII